MLFECYVLIFKCFKNQIMQLYCNSIVIHMHIDLYRIKPMIEIN